MKSPLRKQRPPPVGLSLAFKLKAAAIIVACSTGFVIFEHFYWTGKAAAKLEHRLTHWTGRYLLTDEQVRHVRALERAYHGNGNPFNPPAHTAQEERAHSEALRQAMSLPSAPIGDHLR